MSSLIRIGERLVDKYGNVVGYIAIGIIVVAVLLFSYGGYVFTRWVNWQLSYESNVRTMVCEMVKPEYLNPEACN